MTGRRHPIARADGRRAAVYPAIVLGCAVVGLGVGTLAVGHRNAMVALALGFIYVALFLWRPAVALLAFVAVRPLVDAYVFQDVRGVTLGVLWGIGMVASAAVFLLQESFDRRERLRLAVIPVVFLVALAALTFTRPDYAAAVSGWTRVGSWVLLMLAGERIARDRHGQAMCWWAGLAMGGVLVLSAGVMVVQSRFGEAYYADPLRQVAGQMPHPLALGSVLLLPFALAGALLVGRRALSLLVAAGLLATVILSYVRTALIGAVVVLFALLVVTLRRTGPERAIGLLVAVGVAVAAYVSRAGIAARFADLSTLTSTTSISRLPGLLALPSSSGVGGAGSGRVDIWRVAIQHTFDSVQHALIGRGAAASTRIMLEAFQLHSGAQNDFLDLVLAGGLLLGVFFLLLLAWMAAAPIRLLRDPGQSYDAKTFAVLALGGMIAFIVMSMLNGIAPYQTAVAAGLLVGLCRGMLQTPGGTFLDAHVATPDDE